MTPADLPRIGAEALESVKANPKAAHLVPVVEAMRDARAALALIRPGVRLKAKGLGDRPIIVVIGDDLDQSRGPKAFNAASLRWVAKRCRSVAIISSAARADVYSEAVTVALLTGSVLIIETQPKHHRAWGDWVRREIPRAAVLNCAPGTMSPEAGHA